MSATVGLDPDDLGNLLATLATYLAGEDPGVADPVNDALRVRLGKAAAWDLLGDIDNPVVFDLEDAAQTLALDPIVVDDASILVTVDRLFLPQGAADVNLGLGIQVYDGNGWVTVPLIDGANVFTTATMFRDDDGTAQFNGGFSDATTTTNRPLKEDILAILQTDYVGPSPVGGIWFDRIVAWVVSGYHVVRPIRIPLFQHGEGDIPTALTTRVWKVT